MENPHCSARGDRSQVLPLIVQDSQASQSTPTVWGCARTATPATLLWELPAALCQLCSTEALAVSGYFQEVWGTEESTADPPCFRMGGGRGIRMLSFPASPLHPVLYHTRCLTCFPPCHFASPSLLPQGGSDDCSAGGGDRRGLLLPSPAWPPCDRITGSSATSGGSQPPLGAPYRPMLMHSRVPAGSGAGGEVRTPTHLEGRSAAQDEKHPTAGQQGTSRRETSGELSGGHQCFSTKQGAGQLAETGSYVSFTGMSR